MKAISVATGGVHRSEQRLQTDVANQLIVHLILVLVQVTVLALVLLTTLLTYPQPQQTCRAAAAGNFGFCFSHWLTELCPNFCVSEKDLCPSISLNTVSGIVQKSMSAGPQLNPFKQ